MNKRCVDPYCYLESKRSIPNAIEWTEWPDVTFAEVYDYLVLTMSLYTHDQLKAKKSLDGYNFLLNGWLNGVTVVKVGTKIITCFLQLLSTHRVCHCLH